MVYSNKIGTCIIGEILIGIARKIIPYPNRNPIYERNQQGIKLDSFGGKQSTCFVNKQIREILLKDNDKIELVNNVKNVLYIKVQSKIDVFEQREDYIEGNLILCECQGYEKGKHKISGYSSSHSADGCKMNSNCAIAYIDKTYSPTKSYRILS